MLGNRFIDSDSDDEFNELVVNVNRNKLFVAKMVNDSFQFNYEKTHNNIESEFNRNKELLENARKLEESHDRINVLVTFAKDLIENIEQEDCDFIRNCLFDRMRQIKYVKLGASTQEYNNLRIELSKLLYYGCKELDFIPPIVRDKSKLLSGFLNIFNKKRVFVTPYIPIKNFNTKNQIIKLYDLALKETLPKYCKYGYQTKKYSNYQPPPQTSKIKKTLPIHEATKLGDSISVQNIINADRNQVNMCNENGKTPLMIAAENGHVDIIESLITNGANAFLAGDDKKTAISIAIEKKRHAVIKILLAKRGQLELSYLENILHECISEYRYNYNYRERNAKEISDRVCGLLSYLTYIDSDQLIYDQKSHKHYGHQNGIAGLFTRKGQAIGAPSEKPSGIRVIPYDPNEVEYLEGWILSTFLPVRILSLFTIILRLQIGEIKKKNGPFGKIKIPRFIEFLKKELLIEIETIHAYHDVTKIKAVNSKLQAELYNAHAFHVASQVAKLKDGEEYSYYSGHMCHALYVAFACRQNKIIIRIDNVGDRDQKNYPHEECGSDRSITCVKPYIVASIRKEAFRKKQKKIIRYLEGLAKAKDENYIEAFPKIYCFDKKAPSVEENKWHAIEEQQVGNCVLENHNVGLRYRLKDAGDQNEELYLWLMDQLKAMAIPQTSSSEEHSHNMVLNA